MALARISMIRFKDLRAKEHREHIMSELSARGVTIAANTKPTWMDLRNLMHDYAKVHHGWVDGNELAFVPQTDYFKEYLLAE